MKMKGLIYKYLQICCCCKEKKLLKFLYIKFQFRSFCWLFWFILIQNIFCCFFFLHLQNSFACGVVDRLKQFEFDFPKVLKTFPKNFLESKNMHILQFGQPYKFMCMCVFLLRVIKNRV